MIIFIAPSPYHNSIIFQIKNTYIREVYELAFPLWDLSAENPETLILRRPATGAATHKKKGLFFWRGQSVPPKPK